jgi:hypothetical protein
MTAIEATIVRPIDGATIPPGGAVVELAGTLGRLPAELAAVTLYCRWYSSEFRATDGHFSINDAALTDPVVAFRAELTVGSQAITLGVSDQPGQDTTAQNDTRHGGVAGGALGPKRCIVHVFRAVPRRPTAGETLSKAASTLEADGPLHWSEATYQAMNRLRYRWTFEPTPADGRTAADLLPAAHTLTADVADGHSIVRYRGPLPDLDLGGYLMRLRVEDLGNPAVGDLAPGVPVVIAD